MHDFYGTVHLRNEPDTVLDAKVSVDLNRVLIQVDGSEIGSWPHSDVNVRKDGREVLFRADGETLVFELEGQEFFLDLLGVTETPPKKGRRRRSKAPDWSGDELPQPNLIDKKALALEARADQIDKRIAAVMAAAAVLVLLGAALTWGPFRLLDPGSFPIGRLIAGIGGFGGLLGLYLAYFDRSRSLGSAAAIAAGVITLGVIFFYSREARLGLGFLMTLIGAQALITAGVLGMRHSEPPDDEDDVD